MKKVIVLHNIITPYRNHQFNLMNRYYKENNIKFKVVFLSESDKNRHWNSFDIQFEYMTLENWAIRLGKKDLHTFFINKSILKILGYENPDKIICFNWDHLAAYVSLFWAKKNKREFVIWSGSTVYEKSWRRTLFKPLVKYLVKNSDKCIGDGTRHKDYLIELGGSPDHVEIFYFQVNTSAFKAKSSEFRDNHKLFFKESLGIKSSKIIFFNGQLIERKGIFELLEGFKLYQNINSDISLLILGRGQEKDKMISMIQTQNIQNVVFADFVEYNDVYKYFSISDVFILPSREEAWGLVNNEAMACGLPVITTYETGSSADLIEEARNGYIIKSNCPECICEAIEKVFENNLDKLNNSLEKISSMSIENMIKESKALNFG